MKITCLTISNFRAIKDCKLLLDGHTALVGDNNTGKSTILEAIDLVLGPERLSRYPVLDEHDFFAGEYLSKNEEQLSIDIEIVLTDLEEEQIRHFRNHIEWWDAVSGSIIDGPALEQMSSPDITIALRVKFKGFYNSEDDDFSGKTFFCSPIKEDLSYDSFTQRDKRLCGFLYLRTIRTGSRALSLESGSLLDIILRLKEKRLQMWEGILDQLRGITIANSDGLGLSEILDSIQDSIRDYVPSEWADNPKLLVSDMTRVHLRKILSVFMDTGALQSDGTKYSAPFQHQGAGTINVLVLALLSMIADLKQNVIFAMEEPEIALPPYTQKRVIDGIKSKAAQGIITSHSPYVLEEFPPANILVINRDSSGILTGIKASYPPTVKVKLYREEVRKRFCEAILSRKILLTEGKTEYDSYQACARRLHELNPGEYKSFEALGVTVVNAESDTQIAPLGVFYRSLGKEVFAVFDKQDKDALEAINQSIDHPFEATEKGFENVILKDIPEIVIRNFGTMLIQDERWPAHLEENKPSESTSFPDLIKSIFEFLRHYKGSGISAELLVTCNEDQFPSFIANTIKSINKICEEKPGQGTKPVSDTIISVEVNEEKMEE